MQIRPLPRNASSDHGRGRFTLGHGMHAAAADHLYSRGRFTVGRGMHAAAAAIKATAVSPGAIVMPPG
ncbi:MAG: hypothetical protein SVR04_07580 [Spirochaetota bacterium]|nr:hypothetical protein [Spirochaetota bacterium]